MLEHVNKLLQISGSKLLFGGEALENHSIPWLYGAIKQTDVFVPLEEILMESNIQLVFVILISFPFLFTLSFTLSSFVGQSCC